MNENDREKLIEALECVNLEYINLKFSEEYKNGVRLANAIKDIKQLKFKELLIRLIEHIKKNKGDSFSDFDNISYNAKEVNNDMDYRFKDCKVVVYTCIMGNYEKIKDPLYLTPNFDYIIFTDYNDVGTWKKKNIPINIKEKYDFQDINRFIKMHPHLLFPEYDFSIYVDGKIKIISDLYSMLGKTNRFYGVAMHKHNLRNDLYKEAHACILYGKGNAERIKLQIDRYKKEGMPTNFGLYEASVIVTDLHNNNAKKLFDNWWNEYIYSGSKRDQLALPYIIWREKRKNLDIGILGNDVERNPKLRVNGVHK